MSKHSRNQQPSFEQEIKDIFPLIWDDQSPEPISQLNYEQELKLKNDAFAKFLQKAGVQKQAQSIIASPKPRHYRTTTKRRVFQEGAGIGLGFSKPVKAGVCLESDLEPSEHHDIYHFLQKTLSKRTYYSLARALNWLIIRGNYDRQFLILNIFKMDADVMRKVKLLVNVLKKENIVEGAMVYFDPSRSDYYLEAERPVKTMQIKHLFGPRLLGLKVDDVLMRYSPIGFSQVNESMVPEMVELAKTMLKASKDDVLLDLYCGYGLFSHTLGQSCKNVLGYEMSTTAIDSAKEISKRLKSHNRMKFFAEKIDANLVHNKFSQAKQTELMLLDPPRQGCEPGVIAQLAKRRPKRVLQIFCGTDVVPKEILEWQKQGYKAKVIQPIDMFAGTPNLETMVLFEA
ncbi:RNA methyltransferase [Lentisphaera araneosa HTCC2155]|uniref:RNA methyltransferase n=2 Tax=Lentisphaera TaxID=256846 RepID=A6DLT9_9BACT|nr:RNA methyltransferase [Lentisphaera araneosa HTCC2155]